MLYKAFISYSHAADGKLAPALHRALHRFARPWYRRRALRVFRDTTNLSVRPGLWAAIESALGNAEYFILLCSPEGAASPWVRQEVAFWLANRSSETLLLVLTDGAIAWSGSGSDFDWEATTALPRNLANVYREEPLFLDLQAAKSSTDLSLNNPAFRDLIADLAATLHGVSKDEIVGDDVRQHRRTLRVAWSAAAMLVLLTVASVTAGWIALSQRDRAVRQQAIAEAGEHAARGLLLAQSDPVAALRVALRGAQLDDNSSTQAALRTALRASHADVVLNGEARAADATFALGGRRIVTAGSRGLVAWDADPRTDRLVLARAVTLDAREHSRVITSMDGTRIAAVSGNVISVRKAGTGELLLECTARSTLKVAHIGFSADGKYLVTAYGATTQLWSIDEKRLVRNFASSLLVHADVGGTDLDLAAASSDGNSVEFRSVSRGPASLRVGGRARTVEFSLDGGWLVATGDVSGLRLWNVAGEGPPADVGSDPKARSAEGQVRCARFLRRPDVLRLATGGDDGVVRVWEPSSRAGAPWTEVKALRGHGKAVLGVEFDSTGDRLLSVSEDGTARIWWRRSLSYGPPSWDLQTTVRGHLGPILRGQFDPSGSRLLTVGANGVIVVSDSRWDREAGTLTFVHDLVEAVDLDRAGRSAAVRMGSGALMVWFLPSGELKTITQRFAWNARFTPDDSGLLVANTSGAMTLHDRGSGEVKASFEGHAVSIDAIGCDGRGEMIATAANDYMVRLWDLQSGTLLHALRGPDTLVRSAFFSPDGHLVAAVWWDGQTRVWSRHGKLVAELDGVHGSDAQGAFSADGRYLAVSGHGATYVWDTTTWQLVEDVAKSGEHPSVTVAGWPYVAFGYTDGTVEVVGMGEDRSRREWTEHGAPVKVAAFSDDGLSLLTGDEDGEVILWDAGNGVFVARLDDHAGEIVQVGFSRDGRAWFSLGIDGVVRVGYRRLEELVEIARSRFPQTVASMSFADAARDAP